MDYFILITSFLFCIFELAFFYFAAPLKLELKFINGKPLVSIYKRYFFLPFTTKISRYENLQRASIKSKIEKSKGRTYKVYFLVLEFPGKNKTVFKNEYSKNKILKYCKEINDALKDAKNYTTDTDAPKSIKIVLFMVAASILFVFIPPKHSRRPYAEEVAEHFYIVVASFLMFLFFAVLSLATNVLIRKFNEKNERNVFSDGGYNNFGNIDFNNKEDINIDEEAKKINNSIIR